MTFWDSAAGAARERRGGEGAVEKEVDQSKPQSGDLEIMHRAAAMMISLGSMISSRKKKIRVTIICDPEIGRYEVMREEQPINPRT